MAMLKTGQVTIRSKELRAFKVYPRNNRCRRTRRQRLSMRKRLWYPVKSGVLNGSGRAAMRVRLRPVFAGIRVAKPRSGGRNTLFWLAASAAVDSPRSAAWPGIMRRPLERRAQRGSTRRRKRRGEEGGRDGTGQRARQ
jgi:hypothetical protein